MCKVAQTDRRVKVELNTAESEGKLERKKFSGTSVIFHSDSGYYVTIVYSPIFKIFLQWVKMSPSHRSQWAKNTALLIFL